MFENFENFHHVVNMDNLFNSLNFTVEAETFKTKVLSQGILQKSNHGALPCIYQEELKGKATKRARGTVKAAVLMGDQCVSGIMVAFIIYQKPFYKISNVAREITWVKVLKKVWSDHLQKRVVMNFLCFCISDDYNFGMNDNNIADQLHLQYQMMRFSCNNKWWWTL